MSCACRNSRRRMTSFPIAAIRESRLRSDLAWPEKLEWRCHSRSRRRARGHPPRPARRSGRQPQPLHRSHGERHRGRLSLSAQRQSGAGPEVRLQAALVRAAYRITPRSSCTAKQPVVLAGDYNVMPTELDVYEPERWVNDALFRPETREAYRDLVAQGWTDALRKLHPDETHLHFLGLFPERLRARRGSAHRSPAAQCGRRKAPGGAGVDRNVRGWEKASDHAPAWIELATRIAWSLNSRT